MSTGGVDQGGYRYTAFGETYDSDPNYPAPTGIYNLPIRWKGAWLMYSTGSGASRVDLYDMRARWWWPQGGVFVQVDQFAYQDRNSTLWGWGNQNPLHWSDPSGHMPDDPAAWEKFQGSYQLAEAQDPTGTHAIAVAGTVAGVLSIAGPLADLAFEGAYAVGSWARVALGLGGGAAANAAEAEGELICRAAPAVTDKIARQMVSRGWTPEQIADAIANGEQIAAQNMATGNPAIRYVNPVTGQSVVIDTVTNAVIHVGGPGFQYGPQSGDVQ